jgi:predicted metallopeptidase
MKYLHAPDVQEKTNEIIRVLNFSHIPADRISCFRSKGTSTRNVIARCYALPKILQLGLKTGAFYVIEVISERFDNLHPEEQTKTLIHELMHIPKSFGGGFRHHDYVCRREVENVYKMYKKLLFAK